MLGKAVIVGPHMGNFEAVMGDFLKADAIVQVSTPTDLETAVRGLLADPAPREARGRRARDLVLNRRGAVAQSVALIRPLVT